MFGVTVFVSDEMPAGTEMILVDADQLAVDPGRVELASTTQADLRLDSETSDGPGQMVSLWRTNMVGVRAERVFGFKLTRGLVGVGHCLEPEHLNMTVLKSFQDLPASASESNLLLPSRQIRNTSLMEKQLAQIMLDTMHLVCDPLEKRVAEPEAQVREFKYVGTWEAEQQYERGNFVTAAGSVWHCEQANKNQRPGNGGPQWVLCVKRGRDER
jgi:hypothetical protein